MLGPLDHSTTETITLRTFQSTAASNEWCQHCLGIVDEYRVVQKKETETLTAVSWTIKQQLISRYINIIQYLWAASCFEGPIRPNVVRSFKYRLVKCVASAHVYNVASGAGVTALNLTVQCTVFYNLTKRYKTICGRPDPATPAPTSISHTTFYNCCCK